MIVIYNIMFLLVRQLCKAALCSVHPYGGHIGTPCNTMSLVDKNVLLFVY